MTGAIRSSVTALVMLQAALCQAADLSNSTVESQLNLANAIAYATTASIFKFSTPCWKCRVKDLNKSSIEAHKNLLRLSTSQMQELGKFLSDPSLNDKSPRPPCAFLPDHGVSITRTKKTSIILIASSCEAIRYLDKEPGHDAPLIYLKHGSFESLEKILHQPVSAEWGAQ